MSSSKLNNTILVTGGAGFIGSNFVRFAIQKKKSIVVVVDKLTYAGHQDNLSSVVGESGYNFFKEDIADSDRMDAILRETSPSAVINFAAETHVDRSIDGPQAFINTNVVGTFKLMESCRRYWNKLDSKEKKGFRFLQISTDEVFGSMGKSEKAKESSPYRPNSPYAASKAAADHFVRAAYVTYGLPTLVTNSSNNFGSFQFPEKLIPLMILNALEGKPLPIYGDGRNIREWLFVDDHCSAVWTILNKGIPGESYNIGSGQENTNIDLVKILCRLLDKVSPAKSNSTLAGQGVQRYDQLIKYVTDRPGHDRRYALNSQKLRKLGWSPQSSFEKALEKTVRWYLENKSWCEAVQKNSYNRERLGLSQ